MKINSEQEMLEFGKNFDITSNVIELIGDVGAGKTTFVRGLAEQLNIKEPVTSPSFTISKSYAGKTKTLIHYDFYRLEDPGIMQEDLLENLKNPNNIIVIEWSDSVKDILPENHTIINIKYNDDNSREVEIQ
ncbi:tRNA (adenosine(37)-N6)-threonylcarbamoyltransferase complex ATPase subunit type 1 TsaE [Candidatus Saccharibacteria bacterium]|nr:tRNA (adenosine(37)-N6)-threonylcarbamoyltransferase complex ATPase subunit type 1 TsaE [Candidatus Saccharibacteria bacterium]